MSEQVSTFVEVGVIDSEDQSRQFISAVLGGTPGFRVTCTCSTGRDALWSFTQNRPNLFLVSLFLKDMTGIDLIQRTRRLWPKMSPILLVPENRTRLTVEALEAGASAYLPKPCGVEELVRTVRIVQQGGAVVSSNVAKVIMDYFRARGSVGRLLTGRERQILTCLSRGLCQRRIAIELGIDKATVRTHVRNIFGKLDVHSSVEAIAFYLNPRAPATIVEPDPTVCSRQPGISSVSTARH